MTRPIVVTYCTPDRKYMGLARRLTNSLANCGLEYTRDVLPIDGPWFMKASKKPEVLISTYRMLDRAVLWCDADAIFRCVPDWIDDLANYDYAIVRYKQYHEGGNLVYFNRTKRGLAMLSLWNDLQKQYPHVHDECILTWLWFRYQGTLRTFFIPERDIAYTPRNRDAPIYQLSASVGHRSRHEIGHKHYKPEFIEAIKNGGGRGFAIGSFEDIFTVPLGLPPL